MRHITVALLVASVVFLHGCAAVMLGGAAAGAGYIVGEDRRPVNVMTADEGIELRAASRVREKYPNAHVNVTSYNRLVLITGEAASDADKAEIDRIVRSVDGVRGTFNELQIAGNSTLGARANDSYVTSKVKARFVDGRKFNPVHVKVVTEAGTVYLMGLVKQQEATAATDLARTTSGVQRVVRLFEYQN